VGCTQRAGQRPAFRAGGRCLVLTDPSWPGWNEMVVSALPDAAGPGSPGLA